MGKSVGKHIQNPYKPTWRLTSWRGRSDCLTNLLSFLTPFFWWGRGFEPVLRLSLRNAHSLEYIQRLASDHDLRILQADRSLLRRNYLQAICGPAIILS